MNSGGKLSKWNDLLYCINLEAMYIKYTWSGHFLSWSLHCMWNGSEWYHSVQAETTFIRNKFNFALTFKSDIRKYTKVIGVQ